MQKTGWVIAAMMAASAGYYCYQLREQNRQTAEALQMQNQKIAELQARVSEHAQTSQADVAAEQKKLEALEHQLEAARTALELAKSQLSDAKEQISVDSRMPTAREDLQDTKSNLKTTQDQLATIDRKLHEIQAKDQEQKDKELQARQRIDANYDWQIQAGNQEINRLRAQLAAASTRRQDADSRAHLREAVSDQEQAVQDLKEQKHAALTSSYNQYNQSHMSLMAQSDSLKTDRTQLQQQLEGIKSHYQDLKVDTDAYDATVNNDKSTVKSQQDAVAAQEAVVAKLEAAIKSEKEVIDHFTAH